MDDQASKRSRELFTSGYFCAESVLTALAESRGIRSEWIPRIASGLCSGIARTGGLCGAVSGAVMGMDLVYGRSSPSDSLEVCFGLAQELIRRFEERNGSTVCSQLIGCDLATEQGQRYFMENNLIERCYTYAEDATRLAVALMAGREARPSMAAWTREELDRIGSAEELQLASLRRDGTLRRPVTIWVVRLGGNLYVRCVNGRAGAWFRGTHTRRAGQIRAGGLQKDVSFVEEPDPGLNDRIDAAYLDKYRRYPKYVAPMVKPEVRTATIRLVPRQPEPGTQVNDS
jgi:C_GCAxxG_C_C family probable redox protein